MNLYLNGVEDFSIVREDTLAHPAFVDGSHLRKFDIVLANPPYSIKTWDRDAFMNDKWGRNFLGTPPQGRADYAFFQHILASMDEETGRCAILFPHGVLFREEEQEMRKSLVKMDLIECVIGIGKNLFYNSPMEACIIICNTHKSQERKSKILFINAKDDVTRKNGESYLEEKHIEKVSSAYHHYSIIDGFSAVIANAVVLANNAKLNIAQYVRSISSDDISSVEDYVAVWKEASGSFNNEIEKLLNCIER